MTLLERARKLAQGQRHEQTTGGRTQAMAAAAAPTSPRSPTHDRSGTSGGVLAPFGRQGVEQGHRSSHRVLHRRNHGYSTPLARSRVWLPEGPASTQVLVQSHAPVPPAVAACASIGTVAAGLYSHRLEPGPSQCPHEGHHLGELLHRLDSEAGAGRGVRLSPSQAHAQGAAGRTVLPPSPTSVELPKRGRYAPQPTTNSGIPTSRSSTCIRT